MAETKEPDEPLATKDGAEPQVTEGEHGIAEEHAASEERRTDRTRKAGKWVSTLSNNVVVGALVAGVVSLLVTVMTNHFQDQNSASQSHTQQQVQAMAELQAASNSQYSTAVAVYTFQLRCADPSMTWRDCASLSPDFNSFANGTTEFGAAASDVADRQSSELAAQFDTTCTDMLDASSAAAGQKLYLQVVNLYAALTAHLGQLIQGQ